MTTCDLQATKSAASTANPAGSLRQQKKARAREAILRSAQALIEQHGYADTKMREVATQADVSYQTLYNYFPTKALILQELLTRTLSDVAIETERLARQEPVAPLAQILALTRCYVAAIGQSERALWREVSSELLNDHQPRDNLLAMVDELAHAKLASIITRASAAGLLKPTDLDTLAATLYTLTDAALLRYLLQPERTEAEVGRELTAALTLVVTPYLTD